MKYTVENTSRIEDGVETPEFTVLNENDEAVFVSASREEADAKAAEYNAIPESIAGLDWDGWNLIQTLANAKVKDIEAAALKEFVDCQNLYKIQAAARIAQKTLLHPSAD